MRRKCSASPSGSVGAQGLSELIVRVCAPMSSIVQVSGRYEHESASYGHRQSSVCTFTDWTKGKQKEATMTTCRSQSSSWVARARPAAASSSGSTARGVPTRVGVALGGTAVRLGRPGHVGAGAAGRRLRLRVPLPRPRPPGRRRDRRLVRGARRGERDSAARAALRPRRGRGGARRGGRARPGAEVTTLRSTWFSQNFSESYFLDGLLAGSSRSRRRTRPSRSSTPTTSPTSRSPR